MKPLPLKPAVSTGALNGGQLNASHEDFILKLGTKLNMVKKQNKQKNSFKLIHQKETLEELCDSCKSMEDLKNSKDENK